MKVAIVLATYNPNRDFFHEQIASIRAQTVSDWLCIISDDSTEPNLKSFIQKTVEGDSRFEYFENKGLRGVFRNFENGLKQIPQDYELICFCDQDDIWERDKLSVVIDEMDKNPGKPVAHSDLSLINGAGIKISDSCWVSEKRKIGKSTDLLTLAIRNQVTGCSMCFRKVILGKILPFPDAQDAYLHDHWVAMLGHVTGGVLNIEQQLIRYRQHGANVIGASQKSNSSIGKKISRLAQLKSKSLRALAIRRRLAIDTLDRIKVISPEQAPAVAKALSPLLEPSILFFLKGFFKTRFQWPEFGLWLQLLIGSIFWKIEQS